MIRSLLLRAFASLALSATVAQAQATTIILVRHAEKAAEPAADPPLTAEGVARARTFAELVKDAGIQAIMSTQFERTKSTAAPIAEVLKLPVQQVDARLPQHPKLVADEILAKHRGHTVLVVGHSNTLPAIVQALGAPLPAPICDAGYDNVFVVTVPPTGPPTVVHLHYGVPTACGA